MKAHEKKFRMEQFIVLLLLLNPYRNSSEVSDSLYLSVIMGLFTLKLFKEYARFKTLLLLLAILTTTIEITLHFHKIYILTTILCLVVLFYPLKSYQLPRMPENVGYKTLVIPGKYQSKACVFYPSVAGERHTFDWVTETTYQKLYNNRRNTLKIPVQLHNFLLSYLKSYKIEALTGEISGNKGVVVFSEGAGGFMHSYTHFLGELANDRVVVTIQHDEKPLLALVETGKDLEERQKELERRSGAILEVLDYFKDEKQVRKLLGANFEGKEYYLMGHSYGGATILNSARLQDLTKSVSGIIALDPYFKPLRPQGLHTPLPCPGLIITFRNPLQLQSDSYTVHLTSNFKTICTEYTIKNAGHLDISDIVFTIGNLKGLNLGQNPERTIEIVLALVTGFMESGGRIAGNLPVVEGAEVVTQSD